MITTSFEIFFQEIHVYAISDPPLKHFGQEKKTEEIGEYTVSETYLIHTKRNNASTEISI